MTAETKEITVIGAGVAGMCAALFLQRDGHKVTVLDRNDPGSGCSYGNAGFISPGTSTPKATPNMLRQAPRWLFDDNGPLKVRPGYALKAAPWLWQYIRAGRPAVIAEGIKALSALHEHVFALYDELADTRDLIRHMGQIHIFETDAAFAYAQSINIRRRERGIEVEEISLDEAKQLAPGLGPKVRHAMFFPDNGHTVSPQGLVAALADRFAADGGRILTEDVEGLEVEDGKAVIRTDAGRHAPEHIVISAGAWSGRLAKMLGDDLPFESQRGYHLELVDPGAMPTVGISATERKFAITPMEGGLRLAGTAEFAGLDAAPDYRRSDALFENAKQILPDLKRGDDRKWMGHRPCFPDSLPVIDAATKVGNVHYAFGHGHTGMSGSPMTGKLTADLIAGRPPSIDPTPFRATRFS